MTRRSQILASLVLTALFLGQAYAQVEGPKTRVASAQQKSVDAGAAPPAIVANPTAPAIVFNPAAVGISLGSAQTLDATFNVSGYSGSFTPTASFHYGHDYKLGAITCSGGSGSETCTVAVTFVPTLPGARKDALLLMDGSTVLATVLLGGTGQSGQALIHPGVVTSPLSNLSFYVYQSVVDENGTVYFTVDNGTAVYSYTKAGVLTQLPLTSVSNPHAIDIDGAGNLYIAQNAYSQYIITYNPSTGVQGAIHVYPPPPYVFCANSNNGDLEYLYSVAVDLGGNVFTLEILCNEVFELSPSGNYTTTAISPIMTQPSEIGVDPYDNVFIGGYAINELTAAGVQTQINPNGAGDGVSADAASTVYATRYQPGGVALLSASDYTTPIGYLDPSPQPLGEGLASDGTLYVGNYTQLDKVDRSQGVIAFGSQSVGVKSAPQNVGVYNGGNENLTVSNITLSGTSFALATASTSPCKKGIVLAPGSLCQVAVTTTPSHAGTFSGTVTFTSNSLNTTATKQNVALSSFVYGPYVTPSPASVAFAPQLVNTTSTVKTVTLTNNGDLYAAIISAPTSSNPAFTVGIGTCTSQLAVGSSCKLSVTFTPTASTAYTGTLTVPINSTGGGTWPSLSINVSGSGTWMALSPSGANFGNQTVGTTSSPRNISLINKGTTTVSISGITLAGPNPGDFAEITNCGSTLAAGAHCVIQVTFTPTTTGSRTAQVAVSDNSGGSPQTAGLIGTGTP